MTRTSQRGQAIETSVGLLLARFAAGRSRLSRNIAAGPGHALLSSPPSVSLSLAFSLSSPLSLSLSLSLFQPLRHPHPPTTHSPSLALSLASSHARSLFCVKPDEQAAPGLCRSRFCLGFICWGDEARLTNTLQWWISPALSTRNGGCRQDPVGAACVHALLRRLRIGYLGCTQDAVPRQLSRCTANVLAE